MKLVDQLHLKELNERYSPLSPEERIRSLYIDFIPSTVLLTSSFAANSIFLLHLFTSVSGRRQEVHFIDTSYHFPETLEYKKQVTDLLGITVKDLRAEEWKNKFTTEDQTWTKNPDFCCTINKVEPVQAILPNYSVWASGLIRTQNEHRKTMNIFEEKGGILRFHPILDATTKDRENYLEKHALPPHPLVAQGYESISCMHCTKKGKGREGRWSGQAKTECGLHT